MSERTFVIGNGKRVIVTNVDPYGFNGRDNPPNEKVIGLTGVIVGNEVWQEDSKDTNCDVVTDEPEGTELKGDLGYIMYDVLFENGKHYQMIWFEIEVLPQLGRIKLAKPVTVEEDCSWQRISGRE